MDLSVCCYRDPAIDMSVDDLNESSSRVFFSFPPHLDEESLAFFPVLQRGESQWSSFFFLSFYRWTTKTRSYTVFVFFFSSSSSSWILFLSQKTIFLHPTSLLTDFLFIIFFRKSRSIFFFIFLLFCLNRSVRFFFVGEKMEGKLVLLYTHYKEGKSEVDEKEKPKIFFFPCSSDDRRHICGL